MRISQKYQKLSVLRDSNSRPWGSTNRTVIQQTQLFVAVFDLITLTFNSISGFFVHVSEFHPLRKSSN